MGPHRGMHRIASIISALAASCLLLFLTAPVAELVATAGARGIAQLGHDAELRNALLLTAITASTATALGVAGGTPLAVSDGARVLGVVHLKDVVKGGIKERFDRFRAMGIRTVMITGDNPRTAAAIAKEAGVDDFLAEAKPEDKLALIRREQQGGRDRKSVV